MDQGPSGKTGFSVKTGEKCRPVGFPWGHGESSGAPLRSTRHSWGEPSAASPHPLGTAQALSLACPFHLAVVSLPQGPLCPRAPCEVHLAPYQDVKMQRQASGSSRLVPELPFWGSGGPIQTAVHPVW